MHTAGGALCVCRAAFLSVWWEMVLELLYAWLEEVYVCVELLYECLVGDGF